MMETANLYNRDPVTYFQFLAQDPPSVKLLAH